MTSDWSSPGSKWLKQNIFHSKDAMRTDFTAWRTFFKVNADAPAHVKWLKSINTWIRHNKHNLELRCVSHRAHNNDGVSQNVPYRPICPPLLAGRLPPAEQGLTLGSEIRTCGKSGQYSFSFAWTNIKTRLMQHLNDIHGAIELRLN